MDCLRILLHFMAQLLLVDLGIDLKSTAHTARLCISLDTADRLSSADDHVEKSFAFECAWYYILDLCRDGLASIYGKWYIVTLNEIIDYGTFLVNLHALLSNGEGFLRHARTLDAVQSLTLYVIRYQQASTFEFLFMILTLIPKSCAHRALSR